MGSNDSPTTMVLWQKLTLAILALIAKTKFDLMTALFTLSSLQHFKKLVKSISQ